MMKSLARALLRQLGVSVTNRVPRRTIPLSEPNVQRLMYFQRLLTMVSTVEGTIVECGVGGGDSLLMLALLARTEGRSRQLWGFDSFEGLPDPTDRDDSPRRARKGEHAHDIGEVRSLLLESGLSPALLTTNITIIKGYFADTLPLYKGGPIALLHVDVDLHESYRSVLEQLQPRVAPGGVTAVDEYLNTIEHLNWPGARLAIDEYFGTAKQRIRRDKLFGKYYFLNDGNS